MENRRPTVALMTDFGLRDSYVAAMKAIIMARCDCNLLDITHEVTPQNVSEAAFLLSTVYRSMPEGTVVVCVVDPGVGTDRRPIAVKWTNGYFVGPDNGWLSHVIREARRMDSGPGETPVPEGWTVLRLENSSFWMPNVSRTFHGRDIFAPVAAALASGAAFEELGPRIETLTTLPVSRALDIDGAVRGQVVHIDHYGNLITDIPASYLSDRFSVTLGGGTIDGPATSYQTDEPLVAIVGSNGYLEIAAPNGNAARLIMAGVGEHVVVMTRHRIESGVV